MSTTSTTPPAPAAPSKLGTFVIVFSITATVLYVLCVFLGLPLFTYHPAVNRFDWGLVGPRSGEGPNMLWYGWIATTAIGSTAVGFIATLLPESVTRKIPLALLWVLPVLALPLVVYSLKNLLLR
jgi:hypothetical protein